MQIFKKLLSVNGDAETGTISLITGDFTPKYVKRPTTRVMNRSQVQGYKGTGAYQDGYDPSRFQPSNRVMAVPSAVGLNTVSRPVASEGQQKKGVVLW